tara:strand:- start:1813 stop:3075 length:1263 start_codon:yes stop_codon:yes gene_type:complete
MANLEGKLVEMGNGAMITIAALSLLNALTTSMEKTTGEAMQLSSGYMSKYEMVDSLRKTLRPDFGLTGTTVPANVKELLDPAVNIKSIVEAGTFPALEEYIESLEDGSFDPPLAQPYAPETDIHLYVYPVPSKPSKDPRRYGRLAVFPTFTIDQKEFLINNAPLYGFVLYGDSGLYFIGFNEMKVQIAENGLTDTLSQFQKQPIPLTSILVTEEAILTATNPVAPTTESTGQYGTMYFSGAEKPLIVVYGGIDVAGVKSGAYMPPLFQSLYSKYNIWIANDSGVNSSVSGGSKDSNGSKSYQELNQWLANKGIAPPSRILYAFSGGYKTAKGPATSNNSDFSRVCLVDIWMGASTWWPNYAKSNTAKVSYFYTSFGAGEGGAPQRDSIISTLGYPTPFSADTTHYDTKHMDTNNKAIATL